MLVLMTFLGFWTKHQGGGLTTKGKITEPAHFVFLNCWVVPSIWQSFIQKGEMACITPAWSSGKLGLKVGTLNLKTFESGELCHHPELRDISGTCIDTLVLNLKANQKTIFKQ